MFLTISIGSKMDYQVIGIVCNIRVVLKLKLAIANI